MAMAVIDYETDGIEPRPEYPPKPVGVAIKYKRMRRYMAFGHPTENNCTKREAIKVLKDIYREADSLCFHNAAFDIYVGREHMGLPFPRQEWHDTLFLAYLHDPRDSSLSLKPLADKYLDMPPEEQDRLKEWILENVPEAKKKPSSWGAYICRAPGKLVGKYAVGDVDRTEGIFKYMMPRIKERGMFESYDRERKIMPIIEEEMTNEGCRVAVARLKKDLRVWTKERDDLERKLRRMLKCSDEVNIDSNVQLADAMDLAGLVDYWFYTERGNVSTSMDNLRKGCNDQKFLDLYARRGKLVTCINTFAEPWLETATKNDGYIFPEYNQTRSSDEYGGKRGVGTRTGRLSSSRPNLQNVPKDMDDDSKGWTKDLPFMRDYLIPDEGCVFNGRDYSQQEMRILAHYEDGEFLQRYLDNPTTDSHEMLRQMIYEMIGVLYNRKPVKETGFGLIYGMGVPALADRIGESYDDAKFLKKAYLDAVPGVREMQKELKRMARDDEPLRTWGGREYYCEEPKLIKGRMKTFEYKMLNYLIQGSAADCTKQAMINVYENCDHSRLTIQVHDELLINSEKSCRVSEMKKMKEAMEAVEFDVPMLSDGEWSSVSWGRMKEVKD